MDSTIIIAEWRSIAAESGRLEAAGNILGALNSFIKGQNAIRTVIREPVENHPDMAAALEIAAYLAVDRTFREQVLKCENLARQGNFGCDLLVALRDVLLGSVDEPCSVDREARLLIGNVFRALSAPRVVRGRFERDAA